MVDAQFFFREFLGEVARIEAPFAQRWKQYSIDPVLIKCIRSEVSGIEDIYVVARHKDEVIVYDDVEEEFGIGEIDSDGVLREWNIFDSVNTCIKCFPGGKYYEL